MQRAHATIVSLVGAETDADAAKAAVERMARARNVRALPDPSDGSHATRAATNLTEAARSGGPYAVTAFDPLAPLASAWVARFDGTGTPGDFEVALKRVLELWRAGGLELPDYYLAVDPDSWTPTRRHWFLGVLHEAASHRVAPTDPRPGAEVLTELRAGRWWPPLDRVLRDIERRIPDAAPTAGPRGAGLLDPAGRAHPPASELVSSDPTATTLTDAELDVLSGQEPSASDADTRGPGSADDDAHQSDDPDEDPGR